MNFFAWIREGVRQSVLLGVSDAVESLGAPSDDGDIRPQLLELLRHPETTPALPGTRGKRNKLGRSLGDIEAASRKAA